MIDEINNELKDISFDSYPAHYPETGIRYITKKNPILVEVGGGGTAKNILQFIAQNDGGKLITIDLCTTPRTIMRIDNKDVGDSGAGDYSSKIELYNKLLSKPTISRYFEYHNIDAYTYFTTKHKDMIDFYFDDGTHHSDYLIPLFEKVIPFCNKGAIIGTHDKGDPNMKVFCEWLLKHERVSEEIPNGESLLVRLK